MSFRQVYLSYVFVSLLIIVLGARHNFNDGYDERCITPNRKGGICVPLHNCPTLYNAFEKRKVSDEQTTEYLRDAICRYGGPNKKVPIVCCERDAGPCVTPEDRIGACVPLRRCNPLVQYLNLRSTCNGRRCDPYISYLESKPFLSDNVVNYMKKSECSYRGENDDREHSRVCCPIFHPRVTGIISGETTTKKPVTPINKPTPATPKPITPKPTSPISNRVKLPEPGEEEGFCGISVIEDRIIGGNITGIYDHPWMALLRMGDGQWACGGSIINDRYVLTAAHCVVGPKVEAHQNLSMVRFGEWDTENGPTDCVKLVGDVEPVCNEPPIDMEPEEIIPHPGFSTTTLQNDIALIRVKRKIPYTEFIRPVCLPTIPTAIPFNLTVVGWGRTDTAFSSNKKLFLPFLPYYDKDRCVAKYLNSNIKLGPGQFCAGGIAAQDSCTGDSGGPVMAAVNVPGLSFVYKQLGVVSFGPRVCGLPDRPGIYTKVEEYMDWILANMRP